MRNINVNDWVIVRGNCSENHEVGRSKQVYLSIGYSDKEEEDAIFTCIIAERPMKTLVDGKVKVFRGIRIISSKTQKVYDVNAEWCVGYEPNSKEYLGAVIIEKAFHEIDTAIFEEYDPF